MDVVVEPVLLGESGVPAQIEFDIHNPQAVGSPEGELSILRVGDDGLTCDYMLEKGYSPSDIVARIDAFGPYGKFTSDGAPTATHNLAGHALFQAMFFEAERRSAQSMYLWTMRPHMFRFVERRGMEVMGPTDTQGRYYTAGMDAIVLDPYSASD